ncbi:hypothetical protein BS50DRAFT_639694 [Corynespora cassiicola Philippines]|uniref:Fungal-specific transcription factor domain-containing protein n=1 Tax=Corynespora cassiicola Philippines TaxID=1448308 RepID=A0A2T2N6E9_CORCC|nr:hypothetical protein BS50DRAFT_639694 [Corynespora cassiicola Philippines]
MLPAWTQTQDQNPFISCVLPLAYDNDLLMHAVLAVSGAHLSHKLVGSASVEQATYKHYSFVLRKLRQDIAHGCSNDMNEIIRLLLVLAFLCQYEILAGSAQATLSLHLQAIQQIFSRLCNTGVAASAQSNDAKDVLSLVYEGYSYMALCNLIIPTPQPRYSIDLIPVLAFVLGLKPSESLSTVFGGSRLLFEMIPRANSLFCRRLAEQMAGEAEPTLTFLDDYAELSLGIETWKMPLPTSLLDNSYSNKQGHPHLSEWAQSNMAGEFHRHALRIYIMTARLGSNPPTPEIESAIQMNVEAMVQISRVIAATPCASNLMWAVIVGGSCVRDEHHRQELAYWLKNSHYQMRHLSLVLNALELLWADPSPKAFGPYGMQYISEKHNLTFCIM